MTQFGLYEDIQTGIDHHSFFIIVVLGLRKIERLKAEVTKLWSADAKRSAEKFMGTHMRTHK